jgi:hypothetical protein
MIALLILWSGFLVLWVMTALTTVVVIFPVL